MANEEIAHNQLRKLISSLVPEQAIAGTVVGVNENEFTCDVKPTDGKAVLHHVKLKPSTDDDKNGFILIPEMESDVIVSIVGNNENHSYVSMFSKIKKVAINMNGATLLLDSNGIKINGDNFGGLIIADELRTDLKKITSFINEFKKSVQTWIPVSGDGGAAFKVILENLAPLTMPTFSKIESNMVKHGG